FLVRLLEGDLVLDERRVALAVVPFVGPAIQEVDPSPIELTAGQSLTVTLLVDPLGSRDPWAARVEDLPAGVTPRARRAGAAAATQTVSVELTAGADAPAVEGRIVTVVLLADGLRSDHRPVSLSVVRPAAAVDLSLPEVTRLRAGGKAALRVRLTRH